ncbi:MAG: ATP-binding protein, partial [Clostridiales bacterium]|jgi:sensor histidine kinase regulating citrate/malate metabolism|nr:ATP-binding protein [Clostridiales bacterium]
LDNKEEALRCLKEFDKPFEIDYISFSTGNPVADALLSEKKTMADKLAIQLSFKGAIPPKGISATDLCVILGNALDNALEACEKIKKAHEKRWISAEAYAENNFFFLSIRNSMQGDAPIKGNAIATTKSDKASHGFGLHSIQTTVKRYGGEMELRSDGSIFEMNISLDLVNE